MSARELLRANDDRFLAVAAELSPDEWAAPSLCDAWSNHDVLAHLVIGYRTGLGALTAEMFRHGGSFDRANAAMARALAADAQPRRPAGRVRAPRAPTARAGTVFPPRLLLGDHVTHELDILFALDRDPTIPEEP